MRTTPDESVAGAVARDGHEVDLARTSIARIRSAMKKTAPLRTPTSSEVAAPVVRGDLRAELGDSLRERVLVDQDLLDRAARAHARLHHRPLLRCDDRVLVARAAATPGTTTTSSPRTTSGHASRSERGIFASTKRSCTFFLAVRRAGRRAASPGRRGPRRRGSIVQPPHSTAPVEPDRGRARARRGRTRAPPPGRRRGRRASSRRATRAAPRARARPARGSRRRLERGAGGSARRQGGARRSSGRISSRIRPRFVSALDESTRNGRPSARQ